VKDHCNVSSQMDISGPLRKLRLALQACPVYFYSVSEVKQLFMSLGVFRLTIRKIGHIFSLSET